jgi:hypothetical protein
MRRTHRVTGYVATTSAAALALTGFAFQPPDGDQPQPDPGPGADSTRTPGPAPGSDSGSTATSENQNIAADMQLTSAAPRTVNIDDQRREYVAYTFSEQLTEVPEPTNFQLTGHDAEQTVQAEAAALDETDPSTVVVGFPAGTPVTSYTLAIADSGAVANRSAETNPPDAAPLTDTVGLAGRTGAPELVSVATDPTLDQATYTFDEPIEAFRAPGAPAQPGDPLNQGGEPNAPAEQGGEPNAPAEQGGGPNAPAEQGGEPRAPAAPGKGGAEAGTIDPNGFGFYTPSGERVNAEQVVAAEGDSVVVSFASDGPAVEDAARFFTEQGAVTDLQGQDNLVGAQGGATSVPDLTEVTQVNQAQYDYTFNEPVKNADPQGFVVYTNAGDSVRAQAVSILNGGTTVRASYDEAADFAGQITAAALGPDAVEANNSSAATNTLAVSGIDNPQLGNGPTSGPDLQNVSTDAEAGQVIFQFDETLDPDSVQQGGFAVVTESGRLAQPREVVTTLGGQVTGDQVLVLFDEPDLQGAQALTVNADAVRDTAGNPNPVGTTFLE